ncbi:uncharacterized protein MYCFIDRAFT_83786 [Pseudocercospora fijiensis CIRAD86]|uniref:BTB domain-containing protein n=1 Tax=Pseudocercospora fijiensis (strain CIRAD86) TaxID=383855 RepID=M3A2X9_PSEFD|nr:uncharacterized protein MYCFIDRAFT_83786 [Pseudocercospora fijiensis CIRAD86]EME78871.1 hypothetical protein MYCFIDRAFT_83786 [Pseudocercospora fijiensis CIRAD86]
MAEDLWKSLQSQDRLIKITIGDDGDPPIYIQQKVLEAVAPWFKNALKHNTFVEGQTGSLSFAEDDVEAWKVLVCWIIRHDFSIATECAMEEPFELMYDIKRFQDEAMADLLAQFQESELSNASDEALNRIFKICPPGSKLAELVALEVVRDFEDGSMDWDRARNLELVNIWSDFCTAKSRGGGRPRYGNARLQGSCARI